MYRLLAIVLLLHTFSMQAHAADADSIPVRLGNTVHKAIYSDTMKIHGSMYNKLWGKHYRELYYEPVSVKAVSLNTLYGGVSVRMHIPKMHGLVLDDRHNNTYFLKPLGGGTSFLESTFFRNVYNPDDFKNTYLGDFIEEAYTIIHPYTFVASGQMADKIGLMSFNPQIVYIAETADCDTITDGTGLQNKLVSISEIPGMEQYQYARTTEEVLKQLAKDNKYHIDQVKYIRTRMFDMLIGDWNKIAESWYWLENNVGDTIIYEPVVVDRSHAFSKVEGMFFTPLLKMLGLNFITNYNHRIKDVKKLNELGYALDIALTQPSDESLWIQEAKYIQDNLTDPVVDAAFSRLPSEMQTPQLDEIKANLKIRRNSLVSTAKDYYRALQQTPVIAGTDSKDKFVIDEDQEGTLRVKLYDTNNDNLVWEKKYEPKRTKEIWLYSLDGDDIFEINKKHSSVPVFLIGGKGLNDYNVDSGKKVRIYEPKAQKERLDSVKGVRKIYPRDEGNTLKYDYENLRHTKWKVTPIGLYDSDLGLNIGTSVSYTIYGFGRSPYSAYHQFSFDYVNGFTYQGIFPDYDSKRSFHISAYVGSPAAFSNFFGFGNSTQGYKDESRKYNRVNLRKYSVAPAFYYTIDDSQEFNVTSEFKLYKVGNPEGRDRFINTIFNDDDPIFDTKYYADLSATYKLDKKTSLFISKYKVKASAGWTINLAHPGTNFPYLAAELGADFKITDRLTFATLVKGRKLLTDKYEFFQSATTELRGFRDNRFIGKSSFYQYSDVRWDMGRLNNPFTPLQYGVFVGVDYGRVWYPQEDSNTWHSSYGGGFWLTLFRDFTGKFSYFASKDTGRFTFTLGMGF
jgi:hypothetical protein